MIIIWKSDIFKKPKQTKILNFASSLIIFVIHSCNSALQLNLCYPLWLISHHENFLRHLINFGVGSVLYSGINENGKQKVCNVRVYKIKILMDLLNIYILI